MERTVLTAMPKITKVDQKAPKTTTVHVAIPNSILVKIRQQAQLARRTIHAHISLLIEQATERYGA